MADLIELDLVVREKGLKQSLSTVERLERQIIRAAKAVDNNRISQERYNKILLQSKRDYQALGLSSQKATALVRKFAEAQRGAVQTTNNLTGAVKKQTQAQMAATKSSNRMGVVTQQAGYQVSDFIVQVQSGTNVFVAFGQQASQLVGILPLMASSIGLTTGAAIALSAALGIIIPLATAVGAAFLRAKETSADAGDALYTFKEASTAAAQEVKSLTIESYMLSKGIESSKVAMLDFAISAQEAKTAANDLANEASILFGPNGIFELGGGFTVLGFEIVKTDEEKLALLRDQRDTIIDQNEQIRIQKANKQTLIDIEKAHNKYLEEQKEAQRELDGFTIDIVESLRRRNQLAQAYLDGGKEAVEKEQQLHDNMDLTAQIQEKLLAVESMTNEERDAAVQAILRQVKAAQDLEDEVKAAKIETEELEQAAKDAAAAFEKMSGFSEGLDEKIAVATAELEAFGSGGSTSIAKTVAQLNYQADALYETKKATGELTQADKDLYVETKAQIAAYNAALVLIEDKEAAIKAEEKATREAAKAYKLQLQEAEKLRKELEGPMVGAIGTVSDAFGDFIARGLQDFKGFVSQILGSFQNMIAQMIATAARNKIMLSLGLGGSTLAGQAAAGQLAGVGGASAAGPIGSFIGTFAGGGAASSGLLGGIGSVFGASGIGLGGSFGSLGTLLSGGSTVAAGGAGFASTLGAALPAIAAVAAVVGLFTKKTKLLDSGLRTTVEGFDIAIETFNKTQSSRLFGLLKGSKKTSYEAASAEVADPLTEAIGDMQQSIVDAAGTLGIGAEAFDDFSYQFKLSLKGLTEEEQLQKINEEIVKMGDSFASLTGIFSNMNELLSVAQERYNLEVQLLQVQGDVVELRRRELETVHVLNRGLAARLQLLQAEGELQGALAAFASAISQQQNLIRNAVDALVTPLIEAIDRTRSQAEASYRIFRNAADKTRDEAENIVDIIADALSSRTIRSEAVERMRYTQAQQQLASFAGGASFDEASLRRATEGVSIDTTKFFGSFEDYARDFYKTQISLTKLAEKAEGELTDVEKQIDVAEKAYQVAMGTYEEAQDFNVALNTLINDLATFTEVSARNEPFIDQIKAEGDRQVELLDQILVETTKQINALLGIENTIADLVGSNVSVGEALSVLGLEGGELAGAVLALEPTVGAIGSHIEDLDLTLSGAIDRLGLSLQDIIDLDLTAGFENLDLFAPLADIDFGEQLQPVVDIVNTLKELDLSGPIAEQLSLLSDFDLVGDLETPLSDLTTEVSALDTAASGLNLGVVGLDGTVGVLSSSIDKEAANLLTLNGTVVKQTVAVDALTSNVVNLDGTVFGLGTNVSDLGMSTDNLGININDLGATLSNAMSGLGSIVSSLSGAVSGLAASNNALASAQQAQAKASADAAAALAQAAKDAKINQLQEAGAGIKTGGNVIRDKSGNIVITYDDGTRSGPVSGSGSNSAALTAYYQVKDSEAKAEALRKQIEDLGGTPTFASGGMHSGGMRLVGERGPELEVTGPSRIYSAQQTKNMLSGGSGEVVSEIRSLRREVSELKSEQRKIGVENVKYNKKNYDLNREWDIIGLPATRTS